MEEYEGLLSDKVMFNIISLTVDGRVFTPCSRLSFQLYSLTGFSTDAAVSAIKNTRL